MDLTKIHSIYFIGIGGIGMSALARHFNYLGKTVTGFDRTQTALTRTLESEGMMIYYQPDPTHIPIDVDLVIYTPAIPTDFIELEYCRAKQYQIKKRAEVLGDITQSTFSIGVAGTHGKTTVSCMVAQMLKSANQDVTAFLGGISLNFNSNYVYGESVVVVEADEYDRSFHQLSPNIAVVTSTDPDHLDIYGSHENLIQSFAQYIDKIKPDGLLILHYSLSEQLHHTRKMTYSLYNQEADVYAKNIKITENGYQFDVMIRDHAISNVVCSFGGKHNIENSLVALIVGKEQGLSDLELQEGIASYRGVKRRFEYHLRGDIIYIDDYAHHPAEIEALLSSVNELYDGKKVTAIFQPHLYSRTQDFALDFAKSLDLADEVLLLDIYPARELPIDGVSSAIILNALTVKEKRLISKQDLEQEMKSTTREVVVSIGAGDIDTCVPTIKKSLEKMML